MLENNLWKMFRLFDRSVFNIGTEDDTHNDKEKNSLVIRTISYASALGASCVLECEDELKVFSKKLNLPNISASTIHNRIAATAIEEARAYSYKTAKLLQDRGFFNLKLKSALLPSATVLHVDGSKALGHYGVSGAFGGRINYCLDRELCQRGGQEIQASLEICKRAKEAGIKIDIVTNDAIACSKEYIRQLREMDIHAFIRIRGNDKRNLTLIEQAEHAIKLRAELGMNIPKKEIIYDDVKFTITGIVDTDPDLKQPILIARIDSEPLKQIHKKEQKQENKKNKNKEKTEWEEISERKMTHYVITTFPFFTFEDLLSIYIDHWTIETHWKKIKRSYWSRQSYKKDPELSVILFIAVSIGICITELAKCILLNLLNLSAEVNISIEGMIVLRRRTSREKKLTLKRVKKRINSILQTINFKIIYEDTT